MYGHQRAGRALKHLADRVERTGSPYSVTDSVILDEFTSIRWIGGERCPHCGCRKLYHLRGGENHKCSKCKRRFSIQVGTIFEGTKLRLGYWLEAIRYLCQDEKAGSTGLARRLNVTQATAWKMIDLLVRASQTPSFNRPLLNRPLYRTRKPRALPLVVQEALKSLSRSINLSTGLDHPGDESRAHYCLKKLVAAGHKLNPTAIRRWALEHHWDQDSARQLRDVAKEVSREIAPYRNF